MLVFKTPAKINLGLRILGKREDGFHELETIFQMVNLYDEIGLQPLSSGIELECTQPGIPLDENNLVIKAARLLQNQVPAARGKGVKISLQKNIPFGAGLGGGSGNAAWTLMGLNVFWDLKLKREDLFPLAEKLGSDVPFFLSAPCALGQGRGERLTPIQPPDKFYVLLVFPGFPIATSEVYNGLNLKLTNKKNNISILQNFLSESKIAEVGTRLANDLEPVVIKKFPVIQQIKERLIDQQAKGALLSGSGSTVFGIFDNPEHAKNAYANLKISNGGLFLTETISSFSEFIPKEMLDYPK